MGSIEGSPSSPALLPQEKGADLRAERADHCGWGIPSGGWPDCREVTEGDISGLIRLRCAHASGTRRRLVPIRTIGRRSLRCEASPADLDNVVGGCLAEHAGNWAAATPNTGGRYDSSRPARICVFLPLSRAYAHSLPWTAAGRWILFNRDPRFRPAIVDRRLGANGTENRH